MATHVIYRNCEFLKEARQTDYTKHAVAVLLKHEICLTISYLKTDAYFPDDKEIRNIYRWTLSKGSVRVWGKFGDSIADTENNERPTAYDILASVTQYPPGDFSEFCSEYGFDTDSRKAERTYRAVLAEWKKIGRIFDTEEALNDLREVR